MHVKFLHFQYVVQNIPDFVLVTHLMASTRNAMKIATIKMQDTETSTAAKRATREKKLNLVEMWWHNANRLGYHFGHGLR